MGVRFFSGGRDDAGKKTIAQEIIRFEVEKKAKLDAKDRFKFIMKRKMEESRKKVEASKSTNRPMSARAEKALKEIAAKKAAKEQKALRRMVIVTPKNFSNGSLKKDGKIFDIAGNVVGNVNTKDGKMTNYLGTLFGHYKPKSNKTYNAISTTIDQYSPYFINMRKMQAMQAAGLDPRTGQPLHDNQANVYGSTAHHDPHDNVYGAGNSAFAMHGGLYRPKGSAEYFEKHFAAPDWSGDDADLFGDSANGYVRGASTGMSVYGTVSNNVWGNFSDNAWGTSFDNVHGTNQQDVWGQATGSVYASFGKAVQMWGTGNGNNYIASLIKKLSQLFGLNTKQTRSAVHLMRAAAKSSGSAHETRGSRSTRSSTGAHESRGPRTTRSSAGHESSGSRGSRSSSGSRSSGSRPAAGPRPSAPVRRR